MAEETVIEFEDVPDQKNTLFTRIRALFDKKQTSDDARFSDVHQAVELCASEVQQTAKQVTELSASLAKVDELESKLETCCQQFDELTTRLNTEDSSSQRRPFSTGGSHSPSEQTNC